MLDVSVRVYPYDNSAATRADRIRIGNRWADTRGDTSQAATPLRVGGGPQIELRPWGHVHNSLAAFAALGFLACAVSLLGDRVAAARAASRISQGLSANCGYPMTAPRCPERGNEAPKEHDIASNRLATNASNLIIPLPGPHLGARFPMCGDRSLIGIRILWRDSRAPSAFLYMPPRLAASTFMYDQPTAPGAKVT